MKKESENEIKKSNREKRKREREDGKKVNGRKMRKWDRYGMEGKVTHERTERREEKKEKKSNLCSVCLKTTASLSYE